MAGSDQFCLEMLQDQDPVLYASLLFLKPEHRYSASVLQAFHLEVGKIAFVVREPMAGEVRLQWWRDVIKGERAGEATANPLANNLLEVISNHELPRDGFIRYLDARVFDLYNDPMPDLETLEAYFGETESFILHMISIASNIEDSPILADACGHGGVAIGLERAAARLSYDRSRQRCFVPKSILEETGLSMEQWYLHADEQHESVVMKFLEYARGHYEKAVSAIRRLPKSTQTGFLTVAVSGNKIKRYQAENADKLLSGAVISPSPLRLQLGLWKTALIGF